MKSHRLNHIKYGKIDAPKKIAHWGVCETCDLNLSVAWRTPCSWGDFFVEILDGHKTHEKENIEKSDIGGQECGFDAAADSEPIIW